MTIGARLRVAREALGFKQAELATKSGCSPSTYQKYEQGSSVPGGDAIAGLVRLGINANWLLTGDGPVLIDPWREIGRLIKEMRGDVPVEQLAQWLDLPTARVAGFENGASRPGEGDLRDIANLLGGDSRPLVALLRPAELQVSAAYEPGVAAVPASDSAAVRRDQDGNEVNSLLLEQVTEFFFQWLDQNPDRAPSDRSRYSALIAVLYKMAAIRGSVHKPELDQMMRALA